MDVLAHQGGWDEMLLVLGPIAVIVGLIVLVRKRVGSGLGDAHGAGPDDQRRNDDPSGRTSGTNGTRR